jgi:glycosyltransferase involved in cell wall biosynthesis
VVETSKISIVVPLYNKREFIIECLESIVAQSNVDWECIIVDDGSTDGSAEVVDDFIKLHPGKWSLLKQQNSGPSSARNLGILNSTGKYIALLDADDLWFPDKLKLQSNFMEQNPEVNLCVTNYLIFDSRNRGNFRGVRSPSINKLISRWLDMRGFGGLVESTGMFRNISSMRQVLFDSALVTTEGLDFMIKFSAHGKVAVLPKFLTLYRISLGQLHRREDLIKINALKMIERYSEQFPQTTKMIRRQNSYFFLSTLRGRSVVEIASIIFKNLFRRDLCLFQMAFWILSRNIRAKLIPVSTQKTMKTILRR